MCPVCACIAYRTIAAFCPYVKNVISNHFKSCSYILQEPLPSEDFEQPKRLDTDKSCTSLQAGKAVTYIPILAINTIMIDRFRG